MQGRFAILLLLAALYVASAADGDVVQKQECPQNEVWHLCGKLCEPTCEVKKPIPQLCPAIVCTNFTADCTCEKGYVRDIEVSGQCIKSQDCTNTTVKIEI